MFLPIGFNLPFYRFPFVTVTWLLVSVALFFVVTTSEIQQHAGLLTVDTFHQSLTFKMAVIPAEANAFYKYFSYQFVHASLGHLVSNMWYLLIFGWIVENALGGLLFLSMSLVLGALAVSPEFIFQANPNIPIVGASGSVAVMMGAAAALFPRSKVKLLFAFIPLPNMPSSFFIRLRYLVYFWLIFQVSGLAANLWMDPKPVAYATHLTGFSLGLLFGLILRSRKKQEWMDVELSGNDLKEFYSAIKAFHENQVHEGSLYIERISKKWPWLFTLQMKLFQVAVTHRQKDLAEQIFKNLSSTLVMLRRTKDAEWALSEFLKTFGTLPPLQIQERVLMTRLIKDAIPEDGELMLQLQSVNKAM